MTGQGPRPTTALVIPPLHPERLRLPRSPVQAHRLDEGSDQAIDQSDHMTYERRHPALTDFLEPDPDPALQPSPSPIGPSVVQPSATATATATTTAMTASTEDGRSMMGDGGSQVRTEMTQATPLVRLGSSLPTGVLSGLVRQPSTTAMTMTTTDAEGGGKGMEESVEVDLNPTKTAAMQADQTQSDQGQPMVSSGDSPAAASVSEPVSTSTSGAEGDERSAASAGEDSAGISKRTVVILSVVGGMLALLYVAFTFWRKWVLHTRDDDRARMADIHWGSHALAHTPSSTTADASPWQKNRHLEDSSPLSAQAALFSPANGAEIALCPYDPADARRSPSPHAFAPATEFLQTHPQSIVSRAPTSNYAFNADNAVNNSTQCRSLI